MISILDDALEDLRISGSVLMVQSYAAPWAIAVPEEARLRQVLGLGPHVRVLPFHFACRNGFAFTCKNSTRPLMVEASEILLCTDGLRHTMSSGQNVRPVPFENIVSGAGPLPLKASLGQAGATDLICGVFMARGAPLNPVLNALPPALKVRSAAPDAPQLLMQSAAMLVAQLQSGATSGFAVRRLLEVLYSEMILAWNRAEGASTPGWFRALDDKRLASAMAQFHARPGAAWTVEKLAQTANLSPSRFAARFREKTGSSVMSYVSRWRINCACRLLRDSEFALDRIAAEAGYESAAAFSRAFRSAIGTPPVQWRVQARKLS